MKIRLRKKKRIERHTANEVYDEKLVYVELHKKYASSFHAQTANLHRLVRKNFADILVRVAPNCFAQIDRKVFLFVLDVFVRSVL